MRLTTNLGLKKPEGTDVVNIDDFNYNADILDAKVKEISNKLSSISTNAKNTSFDNSSNGMAATNVQDAIEENKTSILSLESEKSDKGHYHSCDENMVTLWKGSLNATSGDIALTDSVLNYKALIVNVGNVGGGKNTSLTIYPFNLGGRQEPHGRIRATEEMYATLFRGSTPYRYYFKPSSIPNNLYFEIRDSSNVAVSSNPDSSYFVIRYIMGVK